MTDVVIVTGGGSGIGRAVAAVVLARSPEVRVEVLDRDAEALTATSSELGERVRSRTCDVTDRTGVSEAVAAAVGNDRLIGLVNAAGNHASIPSLDMSPQEWHSVLDVHLDGTFFCAQAAARSMMATGGGSIVNFSSVASNFAWPRRLPYAVAKAAVEALTRTLAVEWAEHDIRVNAVAPGYVNTPMIEKAVADGVFDGEERRLQHAVQRFAEPVEVAEVVEFLLSDRASFITGEVVRVDGGFSVKK